MEEFRPDAAIHAHGLGQGLHIRAHGLAEVGHLVDEGNLSCQEGIGGVFDQLRRLQVGKDDGCLIEVKGR